MCGDGALIVADPVYLNDGPDLADVEGMAVDIIAHYSGVSYRVPKAVLDNHMDSLNTDLRLKNLESLLRPTHFFTLSAVVEGTDVVPAELTPKQYAVVAHLFESGKLDSYGQLALPNSKSV